MNEDPSEQGAPQWILDPGHSSVGFSVRHMMITNVRGVLERFQGAIRYDAARPEATRVDATIEVASIRTGEPRRDADLCGELFFDAERYPLMTFVSRSARSVGAGAVDVQGELTLRGTTREVTLAVRDISAPARDLRGQLRVGATATTELERAAFGLTWNKMLDGGGLVVGEVVRVTIEISMIAAA